jgi:hypothetical protein
MLIIREAQLRVLSEYARGDLQARMLAHLRRFFPARCAALGERETEDLIAHGVERARRYNLDTEAEICKYLNLMFSFGRDFDTEQDWAARVLTGRDRGAPDSLIDRLYSLALVNENRALDHA